MRGRRYKGSRGVNKEKSDSNTKHNKRNNKKKNSSSSLSSMDSASLAGVVHSTKGHVSATSRVVREATRKTARCGRHVPRDIFPRTAGTGCSGCQTTSGTFHATETRHSEVSSRRVQHRPGSDNADRTFIGSFNRTAAERVAGRGCRHSRGDLSGSILEGVKC